jgi:hypothetical protein
MITLQFRRAVEAVIRALLAGEWAWQDWTPTITQGVAVTATVTRARYCVIGKVCHARALLAVTGTGSASQIRIAGLPTGMAPNDGANNCPVGTFVLFDASGSTFHTAAMVWNTAGDFRLLKDGATGFFGSAVPLANGDTIRFNGAWEIA